MAPRRMMNFRIDEDLAEGLRAVREAKGIPDSEQIRRAIRMWLDAQGVREPKTERKRADTRKRS